jgi:hypothetical protein
MGTRSDIKQVIPKAVSYNQIFGKKTTPDERLYLLKMVQKGMKSSPEMKTGLPSVSPPPLPTANMNDTPRQPYNPPNVPEGVELEEQLMPDLLMEDEEDVEEAEDLLQDELMAQDVVEPVVHQSTLDEEMEANEAWTENVDFVITPVVLPHKHSDADDVDVVLTENSFGGGVNISAIEPTLEIVAEVKADETTKQITMNGIGPRMHTDSNRLKAIQQKARNEMFSQSRTIGPMREQVSQFKTTDERMSEKEKKKIAADKKARGENFMRSRDFGKLGVAPKTEMLDAVPEKIKPIVPEKIKPMKAEKKAAARKPTGIRKSERIGTSKKVVEINNLKLIILKLTKQEAELKKKGKKLSNNRFKVLLNAEKKLAELLK